MKATLLLFIAVATCCTSIASAAERPNIVLILSDDQAWTDYGFMDHPQIKTPHLDKLAGQGATFTRGYVPVALCRPSLATIATGLYPYQHGILGNDPDKQVSKKDPKKYTELRKQLIDNFYQHPNFIRMLADAGYRSHQSGKWWEGSPKQAGFTEGMTRGFPQPGGRHGDDGLTIGREGMSPVLDFIDRATADKVPFFVWYAPFMPHTPHTPPQRLLDKYTKLGAPVSIAKYQAMCEWFDETCGTLLDHLDQKGVSDNTLVIYICDNGWIQNPNGGGFLAGSKQSANEAGVRQPTIYRWPAKIAPRTDNSTLVNSIDIMPTVLAAVGIEAPKNLPGINLLPHLTKQTPVDRKFILGEGYAHDVVDLDKPETTLLYRWTIEGDWKLLLTYQGVMHNYQAYHPNLDGGPQLYNLANDPHEKENLAQKHPEIVERLKQHIQQF